MVENNETHENTEAGTETEAGDALIHALMCITFEADQIISGTAINLLALGGAGFLMVEIFGDAGVHARSAVGVSALPLDAPVEVEMIVALAEDD